MNTLAYNPVDAGSIDSTTVAYQLDTATANICGLQELIANLEKRLDAVLAPPAPATLSEDKPVRACECQVAIRVQNLGDQISCTAYRVEELLKRVRL